MTGRHLTAKPAGRELAISETHPTPSEQPPKKPRAPRRPTADRKRQIARVAAKMFAERGYHATGISELTAKVGLGKGAFYYHIGSKEELLYDIVTEHVRQMVAVAEEMAGRTDLSPVEKVRALSRELMRTIADNLPELTVFFHEIATLTNGSRGHELVELRDRFETLWARILEEGVEAKVFRQLDPVAIKGLLGMHNYSYLWIRPRGRLSPEQISETFCDIVLTGILEPGQGG